MNKTLGAVLLAGATIFGIGAETAQAQLGFAGLLSRTNREDLPDITLASGKPVAASSPLPKDFRDWLRNLRLS